MSESINHQEDGWTFRLQPCPEPQGLLIAIHGWTGNELSMGIFTRKLQSQYWIIFPRAPYLSPSGGYSWAQEAKSVDQDYPTFRKAGIELLQRIYSIISSQQLSRLPICLMGFSQGAALALTLSLEPGFSTHKTALLAGFLPINTPDQAPNLSQAYLISHGTQDNIVPIAHAYQTLQYLEKQKAQVDFCETDTGHKLGMACVKSLETFFIEKA